MRSMSMLAMEMGRSVWLAPLLLIIPVILASFCHGEAATADGQPATAAATGAPPDTNVLCVSRCGTCPTVCSSPPPPPPSSPESGGGDYSSSPSPPRSSTPPPPPSQPGQQQQQPQTKGGRASNYYYFFTAGSSRRCAAASNAFYYTLPLLALLSLAAV